MANPNSTLNFGDNLILKGLDSPNKMAMVYMADHGYNVIQQLSEKIGGKSEAVKNPKFFIPKVGNTGISSVITASSASGGNLLVTVTDATNFRVDDVVADSNLVQGTVTAKAGNVITVAPDSGSSFTAGTHFAAGAYAKVFYGNSASKGSAGRESIYVTPDYENYNFIATMRDTLAISRRDMIATYPQFEGKNWYFSQQEYLMRRFSRMREYKWYFSNRADNQALPGGQRYQTGGVRWQIINNGGSYYPQSSALTATAFDEILYDFRVKSTTSGRKVVALMGMEAMNNLQGQNTQLIQTGVHNTFGGASVTGLDVKKYAKMDMEIEYVWYPLFDDRTMFPEISTITGKPKMSSSILLLDLTPTPAADGSGMLPTFQKVHFEGSELIYKFLPGMLDSSQAYGVSSLPLNTAVSDVDGLTIEILADEGLKCIPDKLGLIELIA